jgi:hypothetical protein
MRRTASILGVGALAAIVFVAAGSANADDGCWYNDQGQLKCTESGTTPGTPARPQPKPKPGGRAGPRYVYTTTDAVVGDCHYWSNVPGGLDAWDPADDAAVIAANLLPLCRVVVTPPVDVAGTAWLILRSWTLDPPSPSPQPADRGITGLPTFLASPEPIDITHAETLPDGRPLRVRARVVELRVDWGDDSGAIYDPAEANPYPEGTVTHAYTTKTCPPEYRDEHPSGGLCHPTLEYYTITATYRWVGEYDVGSGWVQLGALDRTASLTYDVDEVRGVPVATP